MRFRTSLILLGSFWLLSAGELIAQQQLTLRDAVLKAGTDYAPERLRGLQWITNTPTYSYVKGDAIMVGTLGKSMDRPLVGIAELNSQLPDSAKLKSPPSIAWESATLFWFAHNSRTYTYDTGTGKLTTRTVLPGGSSHEDFDETTGRVAYTVENDLYIAMPGNTKPKRVTSDGADGIVNGKSVHREEYGITKGTLWSPGGNMLAFYRMDESMVTPYQLEDISTKPSTFEKIRYPMAGQTSHHVTVGVFDVSTGHSVFLKTGEPLD
ncbi:MAG TPA: DPP IV N-terminal domain-containing protein, partial [Flavobacteriales bacterium]|nr:DPP IV N-terminal domain-containing protein [Flavobacteriales bacterium]